MSKQVIQHYTFDAAAKTIGLSDFSTVLLERLALITDVTTNQVLYNFADPTISTATVSGNVITLSTLPAAARASDALRIDYNVLSSDPIYDAIGIAGDVASGSADSGNPVKVGGRYNASPPLLANGQRADLQLDSSGRLQVNTAPLTATADTIAVSDGTNSANVLAPGTAQPGGNALLTAGTTQTATFSVTSPSAGTAYDVSNYASVRVQITAQYSGTSPTVNFQASNDGTNWYATSLTRCDAGAANGVVSAATATTGVAIFTGSLHARYFRLNFTGAYSSGATTGVIMFSTAAELPSSLTINTNSPMGSAVPSNGFYMGVKGSSGNLTGLSNYGDAGVSGTTINALLAGSFSVYNGTNADMVRAASAAAGTSGTGLLGAGALGIYNTVQPSVTSGTYERLQLDSNANLRVAQMASAAGGYSYSHISTNTTTVVKSGAGTLNAVVINNSGTSATATIFDSTTGSGSIIATINTSNQGALRYQLAFSTGLTVVTAGTAAADVTVVYK